MVMVYDIDPSDYCDGKQSTPLSDGDQIHVAVKGARDGDHYTTALGISGTLIAGTVGNGLREHTSHLPELVSRRQSLYWRTCAFKL